MFPTSVMKEHDIPGSKRPVANFHPSIWKDHFISLSSGDTLKVDGAMIEEFEKLKEEVRKMLVVSLRNPMEKLELVDSIQQLGVYYHFEDEIVQILKLIYMNYNTFLGEDDDLHITSLRFRLLRQQGYKISCDIFSKFIEKNGKFKESLGDNERGVLSLYEAAHMRGHGEDVLEEALEFSTTLLKKFIGQSSPPFAAEVNHALKCPIRKDIPRKKAREYLLIYQQHPSHNHTLLTFSKLDFNILQKLHQKELSQISRWWKDLNVPKNFPFARDRIVECYLWILGVYFEPHFNVGRKILTKVIAMTSILDDMYDAYGTFEELQVFTLAIKRWDISMINVLPEYMKVYYTSLLYLFEEIDKEIGKDGASFRVHFAKEAMKRQAEFYLKEAEWLNRNYKPNFEEYMEVALVTTGYSLLATTSFVGMGDIASKEVFDWLFKCPKIIEASTIICRLMDDVVSRKREREREHIVSAVECYMVKYGCSEVEAIVELQKKVEDAWKNINEACIHPIAVPMPFLLRVLNLSRIMTLLYSNEDGYTNAKGTTKFLIQSLLVDPII